MGLCLGPCSGTVDQVEYAAVVDEVILFLRGRMPELIKEVKEQMESAAVRQDFETAAAHRDRLFALQKTLEKQVATTTDFKDRDVVGMARQGKAALVMVLFIRGGFLVGNRAFHLSEAAASDGEIVVSFMKQYYESAPFVPKEVLLPKMPEDQALLEEWLGELKGERVYIIIPQRGEKARILEMAVQNAEKSLQEQINASLAEEEMLYRVQTRLALDRLPERIECFDMSNIAGIEGVGGMVVFERGNPRPRAYRKYRIKTAPGADDYAMLREVLKRRYKETDTEQSLPDLLVVDGGKGQLNVAVAVLKTLNLDGSFDLVGIAKKDRQHGETDDKVYKAGRKNPLNLKKDPEVLLFFQRIRDEAHRYVITYHRRRRLMTYRRSVLEDIPGIGMKRRAQLLKHFGSLKRIRDASLEELCCVAGMTRRTAERLFHALRHPEKKHDSWNQAPRTPPVDTAGS
jgi:excinuclease ABC subunit C